MPELSRLLIKRWLNGRPAEIWIAQLDVVEGMIKEHKLKPLGEEHYPVMDISHHLSPMEAQLSKKTVHVNPKPFPGGLKHPHLHFKDEIYLLDNKQWREFSVKVIKSLKDRLNRARTVSFDQLLEASAGIDGLP